MVAYRQLKQKHAWSMLYELWLSNAFLPAIKFHVHTPIFGGMPLELALESAIDFVGCGIADG